MQDSEGRSRKSDEITATPKRGQAAEVTPRPKTSEREQANAKKAKHQKKKGLENYFGMGERVGPPSLVGTPTDAAGKRRGEGHKDGQGNDTRKSQAEGNIHSRDKGDEGQQGAEGFKDRGNIGISRAGGDKGTREERKVDQKGTSSGNSRKNSKKSSPKGSDDEHSRRSKRTRSDDDASSPEESRDGQPVDLESIKGALRRKGTGKQSHKVSSTTTKKTATFADAVVKDTNPKKMPPRITHNKCVVSFSVRVDRGKDTQAAFGKKIIAALMFLQQHIDKHAAFFALDSTDSSRPPIKEKADLPGFQVILRRYFAIPNGRAFDTVNQEGGRAIRGSAVIGFSLDPKQCLDEAAGDLRHMGCAIFFKQCQEVNTVARQLLLGAPNTIEEAVIQSTIDEELRQVERRLVEENNAEYKFSERRLSKWLKYAVVREFPAGMPWEGAEEKKQKQGTNNARLAYAIHVHEPDYARLQTLLAFAKSWKVWHKHWGNTAFTVEIPDERSSQAEKTRYIQMVQTHGSVQLSMGAALLDGLIDVDTSFSLRLLPDADGNSREPTTTSIREIFNLMEIQGHKVWICLSTGSNGLTTGYFSSVVQTISEHVTAFAACPGAQVYWWLRRRGCLTDDINRLIRHCFTLSQQQKVTASKYLKDLGHAVVDRTDGDDIIQASSAVGIFDLTLGLSDKERRSMASTGHDAAAITFGEAKDGAIEAHNFSSDLSLTSLHTAKKRGQTVGRSSAKNITLAQSVYSIGTSKVTNESDERLEGDDETIDGEAERGQEVTFDGMDVVERGETNKAMLLTTASMEEESRGEGNEESSSERESEVGSQSNSDDSTWQEDGNKEVSRLAKKMDRATSLLKFDSDEEGSDGSDYKGNDLSERSGDHNLDMSDFESCADEVSSGEFDAQHVKRYANPKTFLQALWNAAGPSPGAMGVCLEILKEELKGQQIGVPAEFDEQQEVLIRFMHQEAGEDLAEAIEYISRLQQEISRFEDEEEDIQPNGLDNSPVTPMQVDEDTQDNRQTQGTFPGSQQTDHADGPINSSEDAGGDKNGMNPNGNTHDASKTHGTLPGAQKTRHAEGSVIEPAEDAGGDREGMQSMSMAEGE